MYLNRTFFALVFALSLLAFTALWGNSGLMIDPNGKPTATAPATGGSGPLVDHGLTIDPNG